MHVNTLAPACAYAWALVSPLSLAAELLGSV